MRLWILPYFVGVAQFGARSNCGRWNRGDRRAKVTVCPAGSGGDARLLNHLGASVTVADRKEPRELTTISPSWISPSIAVGRGAQYESISRARIWSLIGPGVPTQLDACSTVCVRAGASDRHDWRHGIGVTHTVTAPIVAVTGTNGKSTTGTQADRQEFLKESGKRAFVGG